MLLSLLSVKCILGLFIRPSIKGTGPEPSVLFLAQFSLLQTDNNEWSRPSGQITEESKLYCEGIRIPKPTISLGALSYLMHKGPGLSKGSLVFTSIRRQREKRELRQQRQEGMVLIPSFKSEKRAYWFPCHSNMFQIKTGHF